MFNFGSETGSYCLEVWKICMVSGYGDYEGLLSLTQNGDRLFMACNQKTKAAACPTNCVNSGN